MEFNGFGKIARLNRDIVITEKLDGTNAQILITEENEILVGSRNRWITPEDDNYGFARWVQENKDELLKLGLGQHFGEWWGQGIQKRYGIHEKRFSLFNVHRWTSETKPDCCHVVPILYKGKFCTTEINKVLESLRETGSIAAPGCLKPEGIIIFHTANQELFKVTLEKDDKPKGHKK